MKTQRPRKAYVFLSWAVMKSVWSCKNGSVQYHLTEGLFDGNSLRDLARLCGHTLLCVPVSSQIRMHLCSRSREHIAHIRNATCFSLTSPIFPNDKGPYFGVVSPGPHHSSFPFLEKALFLACRQLFFHLILSCFVSHSLFTESFLRDKKRECFGTSSYRHIVLAYSVLLWLDTVQGKEVPLSLGFGGWKAWGWTALSDGGIMPGHTWWWWEHVREQQAACAEEIKHKELYSILFSCN